MNALIDFRDHADLATEKERLAVIQLTRRIAGQIHSYPFGNIREQTMGALVDFYGHGWMCLPSNRRETVMTAFDALFPGGTDQDLSEMSVADVREAIAPMLRHLARDEVAIRARIARIKGETL